MRHIPYWITYRADLDQTPAGSLVVLPDNYMLDAVDGAMLQRRGLGAIIMAGCSDAAIADPATYAVYLGALRQKLRDKGISPAAVMIEEEWFDRVNNPGDVGGWPSLAGLNPWQKKDLLRTRLGQFVRMAKNVWPFAPVIAMETKWNEDRAIGYSYWHPDYGADVLGLDAYLHANGWPAVGTPPLTSSDGPETQSKFEREVQWMLTGVPEYNWRGTLHYGKPVIIVPQAFRDRDPNGMWRTAPTPAQLRWWYDLAQRHDQVVALAWFCQRSAASILGMEDLPDSRGAYDAVWQENEAHG